MKHICNMSVKPRCSHCWKNSLFGFQYLRWTVTGSCKKTQVNRPNNDFPYMLIDSEILSYPVKCVHIKDGVVLDDVG